MFREIGIVVDKLVETRRNRGLNQAEFEAERLKKFRRLARFANQHSEYYADIIRQRGINIETCTPADFPLLTKSILMANFDRIVTDKRITKKAVSDFLEVSKNPAEKFLGRWRVMHTSGTSGEIGYFLYSNQDWLRGLLGGAFRQRRRRLPRRPNHKGKFRFAFFGATGGHFAGVTMTTAVNSGIARLFVESRAFEVNNPLPGTIDQLNAWQPDILSGYTAALRMLGEKQNEGALKIAPLSIAATGETVTKSDMEFLGKAFGCEVTSAYGCTEHLGLGASDPGGETMTLNDQELIFEFYDDHSVITNLFNYTMPLIRYRMSDILVPAPTPPGERRLVIKNLVGRTERMPTFLNTQGVKDFISPHTINEIIVPGVTRFQMHLTGASSFDFLIVLDPALDQAGRAKAIAGVDMRLKEILGQKGMPNVTFNVKPTDDLPVDPRTRKFKLIVDDRETVSA